MHVQGVYTLKNPTTATNTRLRGHKHALKEMNPTLMMSLAQAVFYIQNPR